MKSRWLAKIAAIICALCLTMGVMIQTVFARDDSLSQEEYAVQSPQATFVVLDGSRSGGRVETLEVTDNRRTVPLYIGGDEVGTCAVVNGEPYISVVEFCDALGLQIQVLDYGSALSMAMNGFILTAEAGQGYFVCNDRYFYVDNGIPSLNGKLALPLEDLVRCLGVTVSWDLVDWRVTVTDKHLSLLKSGSDYYDATDVYWLSRFIHANASGEPLEAQVAVGSVCVNRLGNAAFAGQSNIYEVIFAKNQFDVVMNGRIYTEPDEKAVMAAKMALEGSGLANGACYMASADMGAGYELAAKLGSLQFFTAA